MLTDDEIRAAMGEVTAQAVTERDIAIARAIIRAHLDKLIAEVQQECVVGADGETFVYDSDVADWLRAKREG